MTRRRSRRRRAGDYRTPAIVVASALVLVGLAVLFIAASESHPSAGPPVVVCVDSTVSTDNVRGDYLHDLKTVARRTAARWGTFYADACGANSIGSVSWPVHARFVSDLGGDLGEEQIENRVDALSKELKELVEVSPSEDGTPFGEMLAVAAGQCEQAGDGCSIYMFTDGKWGDGELRVQDGVEEEELANYLKTYRHQVRGLAGVKVNFIGVGYGTEDLGGVHLGEAEEVAEALVEAGGGEMGSWAKRLP